VRSVEQCSFLTTWRLSGVGWGDEKGEKIAWLGGSVRMRGATCRSSRTSSAQDVFLDSRETSGVAL
jgi:hypothetical protein